MNVSCYKSKGYRFRRRASGRLLAGGGAHTPAETHRDALSTTQFSQTITIGQRRISANDPVLIIAEAGINHNGDLRIARELIDVAADAGADMVKFQAYDVDRLLPQGAAKPVYQQGGGPEGESQYEMLRKRQFGRDKHADLKDYAGRRGIGFLSTPYHLEAAEYLREIGCPAIKIASTDATNIPLIRKIGEMGLPTVLATGMCDMVEAAAAVRAFGETGNRDLVLLHCVAEYPYPVDQSNLRAMVTLRGAFGTLVGFSDHSFGVGVGPFAVPLGAVVLEKHYTLDRDGDGPDHRASLLPNELAEFIAKVREVESLLGDGVKRVAECESPNKPVLQKSLAAARVLVAGDVIGRDDLRAMRPGNGISPILVDHVVGKRLRRSLAADEPLRFSDIE